MPSVTEDQLEIMQLMYRYGHTWDNLDAEGWAGVFTDDGYYYTGGGQDVIGREALTSYAKEFGPRYSGRFHMVTNPLIAVEGDAAKAHAYFLILEGLVPVLTGTYDDEMVRTPQGWRFAKRAVTILGPGGYPPASHEMAAGLLSPRLGLQHRGQLQPTS
jgi:hypothetical protein